MPLRRNGDTRVFVPDAIRRCVVFLGIKYPDGRFEPEATGFLVLAGETDVLRQHLVTALHVRAALEKKIAESERSTGEIPELAVRMNMADGTAQSFSLKDAEWWEHPQDETDVTLTPFCFQQTLTDQFVLPLFGSIINTCTKDHLRAMGAGLGQEVAIVGLFSYHSKTSRNVPIIRTGNIAAMPNEKVYTDFGYVEGFLVEARSISGLSGSPVFVNLSDGSIYQHFQKNDGIIDFGRYPLLGLMQAHWELAAPTEKRLGAIQEGLHTGIGVVIPIQKIIETLYQTGLVPGR
jgi:hypothetical protein